MNQKIQIIAVLLVMSLISGCMTSRLTQTEDSDRLIPHKETHWNLFWGLRPERPINAECGEENICWVEARTNLGFLLISVASVGIAVPQRVVWQCCPEDPEVEHLEN